MSMDASLVRAGDTDEPWNDFRRLREAREIVLAECRALEQAARRLDESFCRAVDCLIGCAGRVIVCGIGKAGLIGRKIAATLASTGTCAHFLHPAEAVHGDLGCVRQGDAVIVLSQSGETDEITRILPTVRRLGATIIALTGRAESQLGRAADITIELGPISEAGALGLAPTASAAAMLAVGDALALVVSQMQNFGREDFARLHPAGQLGFRLSKVEEHMRPLSQCRVASAEQTVRQVLVDARLPGRRTGAVMLVDSRGRLAGIFTDSDLARLLESRTDGQLDQAIGLVMTASPLRVKHGSAMVEAVHLLAARKISELPVVDDDDRPVGLIDITDVVSLLPPGWTAEISSDEPGPPPSGGPWRVFRGPETPVAS